MYIKNLKKFILRKNNSEKLLTKGLKNCLINNDINFCFK